MRSYVFLVLVIWASESFAAMSAAACKAKIRAAHLARTGQVLDDSANNNLLDLCQGIIDEITADAKVQTGIPVSTTGGPTAQTGSTTALGTIQ